MCGLHDSNLCFQNLFYPRHATYFWKIIFYSLHVYYFAALAVWDLPWFSKTECLLCETSCSIGIYLLYDYFNTIISLKINRPDLWFCCKHWVFFSLFTALSTVAAYNPNSSSSAGCSLNLLHQLYWGTCENPRYYTGLQTKDPADRPH